MRKEIILSCFIIATVFAFPNEDYPDVEVHHEILVVDETAHHPRSYYRHGKLGRGRVVGSRGIGYGWGRGIHIL
ncbi:hypothetical protein FQA39_LY11655 [Lamprigera yunnana]|nr:hypothetical protein FQA39_LY11655 [Lamprigera yunnana]